MDTTEILVVIGGVGLIAFVLWYFFGEREAAAATLGEGGTQEIKVTVNGKHGRKISLRR